MIFVYIIAKVLTYRTNSENLYFTRPKNEQIPIIRDFDKFWLLF